MYVCQPTVTFADSDKIAKQKRRSKSITERSRDDHIFANREIGNNDTHNVLPFDNETISYNAQRHNTGILSNARKHIRSIPADRANVATALDAVFARPRTWTIRSPFHDMMASKIWSILSSVSCRICVAGQKIIHEDADGKVGRMKGKVAWRPPDKAATRRGGHPTCGEPPDMAATRHDANHDASRRGSQPMQSAVTME
jgi:hypothetical protein